MSSLRTSWRVRPKSQPLQPPRVMPAKSNIGPGDEIRSCSFFRIGKHVSGITGCPMSGAPTATAAGGRTFFRSTATAGFIGVAFDPDDGENQYDPDAFAWSPIHG